MNVILTKKQLNIIREAEDNKPALSQSNSEMDNNPDSAQSDYSNIQQNNSNNLPIDVNTQSYMNTPINPSNLNKTMTIKKDASTGSEIQKTIATTSPENMPGKIRVENKKMKKSIKEGVSFSKKELDKFLKSL